MKPETRCRLEFFGIVFFLQSFQREEAEYASPEAKSLSEDKEDR